MKHLKLCYIQITESTQMPEDLLKQLYLKEIAALGIRVIVHNISTSDFPVTYTSLTYHTIITDSYDNGQRTRKHCRPNHLE